MIYSVGYPKSFIFVICYILLTSLGTKVGLCEAFVVTSSLSRKIDFHRNFSHSNWQNTFYKIDQGRKMKRSSSDPFGNEKEEINSKMNQLSSTALIEKICHEPPSTKSRKLNLLMKARSLLLYSSISKKISRTKELMFNLVPRLLLLKRMEKLQSSVVDQSISRNNDASTINSVETNEKNFPTPTILNVPGSMQNTHGDFETIQSYESLPHGSRWKVCHPEINLSGKWSVVVSPKFKREYDLYLQAFGQPALFRAVALNVISLTKESLFQNQNGTELTIKGTNPRGVWERTLVSSGSWPKSKLDNNLAKKDSIGNNKLESNLFKPKVTKIVNAGGAEVEAECWWEENGTVHTSWVRNAKEGDFHSRRYIDKDGFYICESSFYHNEKSICCMKNGRGGKELKKTHDCLQERVAFMTWKFKRDE